jgi:hypothetical protein
MFFFEKSKKLSDEIFLGGADLSLDELNESMVSPQVSPRFG